MCKGEGEEKEICERKERKGKIEDRNKEKEKLDLTLWAPEFFFNFSTPCV